MKPPKDRPQPQRDKNPMHLAMLLRLQLSAKANKNLIEGDAQIYR
jgi:hypothetical protein